MLAQASQRRLGFGESARENRGAFDAAPARDPDRLRRPGDPPAALELREPHLLLQHVAFQIGDFGGE